jgi:hypothetical protein
VSECGRMWGVQIERSSDLGGVGGEPGGEGTGRVCIEVKEPDLLKQDVAVQCDPQAVRQPLPADSERVVHEQRPDEDTTANDEKHPAEEGDLAHNLVLWEKRRVRL